MSALPQPQPWSPPEGIDESLLKRLAALEAPALWWLGGYLAALAGPAAAQPVPSPQPRAAPALAVVHASQTGNARRVAERLARELEARGHAPALLDAAELPARKLAGFRELLVAVSTHGDGDPPDAARGLFAELAGARAPRLEGLRYAVLALGDSSYPRFCAAGRWLDRRLAELGGERLLPLAEADLEIDAVALPWQARLLERLGTAQPAVRPQVTPLRRPSPSGREHPLAAELLEQRRITDAAAEREVRHLVLGFGGSAPPYEPGDALGVLFAHPEERVERVLAAAGLDGDSPLEREGGRVPLRVWLAERCELTRLSRRLVEALAAAHGDPALAAALADGDAWRRLVADLQVAEALRRWPRAWRAEELAAALAPLAPRLYSIASSRLEEGEVAALAVALVRTATPEGPRDGAGSGHLAALAEGARLRVFWEPNPRFRLPAEDDRDLVMVGAGTGIAPFRAFLQERAARGARGRHWLLYGARRRGEDFLYQLDWLRWRRRGLLHRLSLAFSRQRGDRAYVQDRLREEGAELLAWIEGGAALYVCGGTAMGEGVEAALGELLIRRRGLSPEEAAARLQAWRAEGRYRRDLY